MIPLRTSTKRVLTLCLCLMSFASLSKATDSNLFKSISEDKISSAFIASNDTLYFLCDGGDRLYQMNRNTEAISYIGSTAAGTLIEAIAYNPFDDELYATNAGTFVHISKVDGSVTTIADVDGGIALDGSEGGVSANDIDGLEFDTWGGFYWASARRGGTFDVLFKIDAETGLAIRDAFGTNIDYIVIDGSGVNQDIDDMAINPVDGKLYAVTTISGSSKLIEVNRFTGAVISSVDMDEPDAEGMGFSSDGVLYATIGSSVRELWTVHLDGTMTDSVDLGDGGVCSDVEAVTSTTAPADTIGGTVWDDPDMDQNIGGAESGISGVTVNLYYDVNGDGLIDAGDIVIQTTTTDGNGDYGFLFGTNANLLLDIDESTLPAGYGMTTDNLEEASFTDIDNTEQDYNNNFGATSGADCDGDGIPDFSEGSADTDNDGINDDCDLDSDNDGILDADEGVIDTDGDGILDLHDLDSDNDGIPDAIEANSGVAPAGYDPATGNIVGTDTDNDGLLDVVDDLPSTQYGASTSVLPNPDHDGDGVNDYVDLDADNDGILDIIEAGGTDTDLDGMVDSPTNADTNSDGYADALTTSPLPIDNTDGNGNPNYIDIDSDDDGLDDTLEGLSTPDYATPSVVLDTDGDGIIDFWDSSLGGDPIVPVDTDGDSTPDYQDLDSDNDSIVDVIEGNDADNDGVADFLPNNVDADGDGLDDAYDDDCGSGSGVWGCATTAPHQDFDTDGDHDWRDIDDDEDGVPTAAESGDGDGNGTPDYLELGGDSDEDGITNALDLDDDNDGILDVLECLGTTAPTGPNTAAEVSFHTTDNGSNNSAFLDSLIIDGTTYLDFRWPDSYNTNLTTTNTGQMYERLDQVATGLDKHTSGTWNTDILAAFQNNNLRNYQSWDAEAVAGVSYYEVCYNTPINTSEIPLLMFQERNGNNSYEIEVFDPAGNLLNPGGTRVMIPTTDYINTGIIADFSQPAMLVVRPITDFAPFGSFISCIRVYSGNNGDAGDGKVFTLFPDASNQICNDTDSDGIPDYLDLDSDNDGCPDAIEGGGIFTYSDIQNDTLTGGVDPDGIPNVATSLGQGIGTSTDDIESSVYCLTIAENDINQTPQDVNVSGNILTNDTDPTGDSQTVQSATGLDAAGNPVNIPIDGTPTSVYDENGVLAGTIAINPDGSYTYDPEPTFTGDVPVEYIVVDENGSTDPATLDINVIPADNPTQNEPPVANDDTNSTELDTNVSGNVIDPNDSDPDDDVLTITAALADTDGDGAVDDPLTLGTPTDIYDENGTLAGSMTLNSNGTYTFDPAPTYTGEVPVDYTISDGNGGTDDATLTITVESDDGNDTFTNDDSNLGPQAIQQTGNIITNDNDPEGDTQTFSNGETTDGTVVSPGTAVTLPTGGSLTINSDGSYIYDPEPDFIGTEVVEYVVCDDGTPIACDTATLYLTTLNVTIAENDINQTPQDVNVSGNILTNDTDPTDDSQTVQSATGLDVAGNPINIPVNGTPTAIYDENGTLAGTIALNTDGTYTYDPEPTFTGDVPVDYIVVDENGATDPATLDIDVIPANDPAQNEPPVANDDTNTTELDTNVSGNVIDPNDSDPDEDALTITSALADTDGDGIVDDPLTLGTPTDIYDENGTLAGSMTLNSNGTYTFDPAPTYIGEVPVDYTISDGNGGTDDATLTITVEPDDGNDTFTNDDSNLGPQAVQQTGNIITNDNDPEGNTQTFSNGETTNGTAVTPGVAVTLPTGGSLTINSDGSYTYDPEPNFIGTEVVEYVACDNGAPVACDTATLYLTTIPTNTTESEDDFTNTPFDTPVSGDVTTNDDDVEGDSQTFSLDGSNGGMPAGEGTVTINLDGTYTYTPASGFTGETSFEYIACDDGTPVICDTSTVFIEVFPDVDPENPIVIANPDANTVEEGQTGTGTVLANDLDPDGLNPAVTTTLSAATVAGVDDDGNPVANAGTLTLNADGTYSFTPSPGFTGTVTQPYTICNATVPAVCDDTELIIDVLPNDGNTTFANDDATVTDMGVEVGGDISTNDTDSESDNQTIDSYLYDSDGDGAGDVSGTIGTPTTVGGTNDSGVFVANAGTLTLNADGTYIFAPVTGFVGNVNIPYTACDDVTPTAACEDATLVITILDVQRDYGDGPAVYPSAWHRAITDADSDEVLDGTTDVWLGTNTDFESSQLSNSSATGDTNDDAITFGSGTGEFPLIATANTNYDIDILVNSSSSDQVYYGLWIDWDNDGNYDDFYSGSQATTGLTTTTQSITTPASVGSEVNFRLRADDDLLVEGDSIGGKTNGEVEDYQASVVLPVDLTMFRAKVVGCNVQLAWTAETEEDFSHYELEWSGDGQTYQLIEKIDGQGGVISSQAYQYFDEAASVHNYYRLKMVDLDGSEKYSEVVSANTDCENEYEMTIYPNPVSIYSGKVSLKFYAEREQTAIIVVDMTGRVVKHLSLPVNKEWNTVRIDVSDLAVGSYFVKQLGTRSAKSFIIQE